MRFVWSIIALFLAMFLASTAFASATIKAVKTQISQNPQNNFSGDDPTYMLTLRCPLTASRYASSRIAVFRTDLDDGKDYAIVSGHGLRTQGVSDIVTEIGGQKIKGCFVMDFSGHQSVVDGFALSENFKAGTRTDWGIIRFEAMPTHNLVRYNLPHIAWESLKHDPVPVHFAFARGLRDQSQNCEILPSRYQVLTGEQFDGVMAHNCRAISGQSGSPLSLGGDKKDLLLGIHLGSTWMLRSPVTGRPEFQGFVRVIDDAMVSEIKTLMERLP